MRRRRLRAEIEPAVSDRQDGLHLKAAAGYALEWLKVPAGLMLGPMLAATASQADAAASLIANQVNIEHPDIDRVPACDIRDDTDLGTRRVTRHVPPLTLGQIMTALQRGLAYAQGLQRRGLIHAAWLVCQQQSVSCGREARLSPAQIGVTSP